MNLSEYEKNAAIRVVKKYLKKGNMARALRDILPDSHLSLNERSRVAKLVHKIVRYRRLYEYLLRKDGLAVDAVNLVNMATEKIKVKEFPPKCIKYSFSDFLCSILSEEDMIYLNIEPKNYIAVNLRRISREDAMKVLEEENLWAREIPDVESCLEVPSEARYSKLITKGLAHVQDVSSQMISKFLAGLGDEIMDYCAGNGGKALTIGYFNKNAKIYAYDISGRKREILRKRAELYGIDVKVLDNPCGKYDVVFVDAPCSGVGASRRNPEAKYWDKRDVLKFAEEQIKILLDASKLVKRYLVYCVCTITPQETDGVIANFLSLTNEKFSIENVPIVYTKTKFGGFVRMHDIMYIALLHKNQN